jgi:hypothetical protein
MTSRVLENLGPLLALGRSLQTLLARLGLALDAVVSARAAREVPEWRMREVRAQVNRYHGLIRTAGHRVKGADATSTCGQENGSLHLPESASCNFSCARRRRATTLMFRSGSKAGMTKGPHKVLFTPIATTSRQQRL